MVAALSSPPPSGTQQQQQQQQNVFPEQSTQPDSKGNSINGEVIRKPRSREITSRYKSTPTVPTPAPTTPARRFPSPAIGRTSTGADAPKRAASAERRRSESPASRGSSEGKASSSSGSSSRPGTPRTVSRTSAGGNTEPRASAQRLWPSSHNLSSSLQLDHTLKPAENGIRRVSGGEKGTGKVVDRKGTPERKRTPVRRATPDQTENARPVDNSGVKPDVHKWPASPKALSRSMDLTSDKEKLGGPGRMAGMVVQGRAMVGSARQVKRTPPIRSLTRSINEGPLPDSPQSISRHMLSESRGASKVETPAEPDETASTISDAHPPSDNVSDSESLSSAGTINSLNSAQKKTPAKSRRLPQGDIVGSSLGEQDFSAASKSGRRLRKLTLSSPLATGRLSTGSSPTASARYSSGSQPPSPSRMLPSSPFRSMPSPSRTRPSPFQLPPTGHSRSASTISSLLHFPLDVRKGKKAMSQLEEAHYLRILHNRWLQWRYVNARADASKAAQKDIAEWSIYNAWQGTQQLRKSVAMNRTNLQKTNRILKLRSMLATQGPQLEHWAALQEEHSEALSGAMEALEAAVLRVPVTANARADVQAIREALCAAVDVMGSVESSVFNLLPKTKQVDGFLSELSEVANQEKAMLEECSTLLKTVAALEVEETSLRTHFVQLDREKSRESKQQRTTTPAKPC